MKRILFLSAVTALVWGATSLQSAHAGLDVSINFGPPCYPVCQPVYYVPCPPPVVYYRPVYQPVYYAPAYVYRPCAPAYGYGYGGNRWGGGPYAYSRGSNKVQPDR